LWKCNIVKKVLVTATVQSHVCQFHTGLMKRLTENGYCIDVAAKNNLDIKPGLSIEDAKKVYDIPFSRSPFNLSNIKAYKILKSIIEKNDYDIIHCNTPVGGFVTRLAARKARKRGTKVVYTAHGFHFYKGAPVLNWLIYFPLEWIMSFLTDVLITINNDDYNLSQRFLHPKKLLYVKGVGFDQNRVKAPTLSKEEMRNKLNIPSGAVMLFSIGEVLRRKNHETVLRAISKIKDLDIYYYIAGNGPMEEYYKTLISELGINATLLGYTRDIADYMNTADIFMFPSIQEGLPIALMEAMEAGKAVIASNIRGTRDLIKDGQGGYLLNTFDVDGFAQRIVELSKDKKKIDEMGKVNKQNVEPYKMDNILTEMLDLYNSL